MISPTNNKYILSFMEKNFLAFFFIFFFSQSDASFLFQHLPNRIKN